MQRLKIITFILWLAVIATAQPLATATAQPLAAGSVSGDSVAATLRHRLDSLLRDPMFETTQLGLMVYDLDADSALYCRGHRQLLRPASCMKLVTAITALDKLGADYQYQTRIYVTGTVSDSVLTGDLYCVGAFDPMISPDDVAAMAMSIRRLGIDSISGHLYADRTMKEPLDYGEGWCWDDDNPLLTALTIGRKDTFLPTLAGELQRLGVNVEGVRMGDGQLPAKDVQLVCTCWHTLGQVLERMMKESDNFYAESVFYQTAATCGRRPAKATDARQVTRQLIQRLGLQGNPYKIADGSGLSLYNYVSAELLVRLLCYAYRSPAIYRPLYQSLPIAGVDGTLKKRMTKGPATGNVRAKTGTLTGISSLAGYCTVPNGHRLCFAIINQGVMRNQSGKDFQDKVCNILCQ